jgi:cysteine desulfurase
MLKKIYLDNSASTPLDPRVLQRVVHHLQDVSGNPSSTHSYGREARKALLQARDQIAHCLNVKSEEIIFTSGGTEGANLVIRGVLEKTCDSHIITSNVEHSCVFHTIKEMEKRGHSATFLAPGLWGSVIPEAVRNALQPNTKLITFMSVNNETGIKTDIEAIATIAEQAGVPFFVDGVALLGKEIVRIPEGVSSMSFSGQKVHAPKGVGFVFIRRNLKLSPYIIGGDQEYGRRGGTENLSAIVGLAEAVTLLCENQAEIEQHMMRLRNKFERTLLTSLPNVSINGEGPRVSNISNLCFEGLDGETLLTILDQNGLAASHGSACSSGALEPSRILLNMGLPLEKVRASLRFSLSRFTTEEEINQALGIIIKAVQRLGRVINY